MLAGRLRVADTSTGVAFLDHNQPTPAAAATGLEAGGATTTTVVPLMISASWRLRSDVASGLAAMSAAVERLTVQVAPQIGVHPLLLAGIDEILCDAHLRPATGLILVTAGMRDPRTRVVLDQLLISHGPMLSAAHRLAGIRVAHLDGGRPIWPVRTLLQRLDGARNFVVVPLVLTGGPARDRVTRSAALAEIPVLSGSLATTRALAQLVELRARSGQRLPQPVSAA